MSKEQKIVVSFKASAERASRWKAYAAATKAKDIGELYSGAMDEFVQRHPLTDEQKAVYNALVTAEGYSVEPVEAFAELTGAEKPQETHEKAADCQKPEYDLDNIVCGLTDAIQKATYTEQGLVQENGLYETDSEMDRLEKEVFCGHREQMYTACQIIDDYLDKCREWAEQLDKYRHYVYRMGAGEE